MKDCQFGVSPVNYSDSDSDPHKDGFQRNGSWWITRIYLTKTETANYATEATVLNGHIL